VDIWPKIRLNVLKGAHERRRLLELMPPKLFVKKVAPTILFFMTFIFLEVFSFFKFVFSCFEDIKIKNRLFLWVVNTPSFPSILGPSIVLAMNGLTLSHSPFGKWLILRILIDLTA